jgi:hypothetical protein
MYFSYVLNQSSVHSAVNNLTAVGCEAINLAIQYIKSKNCTFLHWFQILENITLRRKINTSEDIRNQNLVTIVVFLLIITNWLKPLSNWLY